MERKIGEIFEYNGEWYQCVTGRYCGDCAFRNDDCEERERITLKEKLTKEETTGLCVSELRSDCKSVIFKKLEKVGEPIKFGNKLMQDYNIFVEPFVPKELEYFTIESARDLSILIEIKQNKEDMEENKLNLKPFDLQKAKDGKPVCTRDGRKARIICFDLKNDEYPIVAAVGNDSSETLFSYTTNGEIADGIESDKDLMMLPEKKEGWVNVYKIGARLETGRNVHKTKEEAIKYLDIDKEHIATVKISWEE